MTTDQQPEWFCLQAHLLGSLSDIGYLLTTIQRNQTLLQQLTVYKLPEPETGYTVHARLLGDWQAVARICHQLARRVDVLRVSCWREHDSLPVSSDDADYTAGQSLFLHNNLP